MPIESIQEDIEPYTTKDGSSIRELMHPEVHGNRAQSLAEATVPIGSSTIPHRHNRSEEIYYITEGSGSMTIEGQSFEIKTGDTICILPGEVHSIRNIGDVALKILCCCSPPYSHDDTELSDRS